VCVCVCVCVCVRVRACVTLFKVFFVCLVYMFLMHVLFCLCLAYVQCNMLLPSGMHTVDSSGECDIQGGPKSIPPTQGRIMFPPGPEN